MGETLMSSPKPKGASKMNTTKDRTMVKRLPARPRINVREAGDGESWYRKATMWREDVERLVGPEPTKPCERGERGGCSPNTRRPCEACADRREWINAVLSLVATETGWSLYSFYRGPGRAFAHEPLVYSPRKHPAALIVSQGGGLDI